MVFDLAFNVVECARLRCSRRRHRATPSFCRTQCASSGHTEHDAGDDLEHGRHPREPVDVCVRLGHEAVTEGPEAGEHVRVRGQHVRVYEQGGAGESTTIAACGAHRVRRNTRTTAIRTTTAWMLPAIITA